jgi:hypothetical protein
MHRVAYKFPIVSATGRLWEECRMSQANSYKIAVLATDGFELTELVEPVNALRAAGATVQVLAPHGGEI